MFRFHRGDLDGFFGLALDNLIQLLLIDTLCRNVIGMSADLLYGRVLPGAAVSLIVGNLYYAWQARQLAQREGRSDVCALPYGINTVSLFGHIFLVMLPAKLIAAAQGAADPARVAWQAGLVACLGSGILEFVGAFVVEPLRKVTPRAALLSTLSGIALGFISLGFVFRTFAQPWVGLTTLGVVLLTYFGGVNFRGGLPGGLVAVAVGTALAWLSGLSPVGPTPVGSGFHAPLPVLGDLLEGLKQGHGLAYLSVILPMGLFNIIGSLQNIESAEAAGDAFPTRPSLAVNGIGSVAAALFGSCFPTTIYIGHPGWKAMGARSGYSVLNAVFVTLVCLTGTLTYVSWAVPVEAGMAIVLWIGIVITAQAFQASPPEHAPAAVIGILAGVGAWGVQMAKNGLRAAGYGSPGGPTFGPELIQSFASSDTWIHGGFALEQGFIFTSMILAAITASIIDRKFRRAASWAAAAAALSACGLMHSYGFVAGDTVMTLKPAWHAVAGYATMTLVFLLAPWITVPAGSTHGGGK